MDEVCFYALQTVGHLMSRIVSDGLGDAVSGEVEVMCRSAVSVILMHYIPIHICMYNIYIHIYIYYLVSYKLFALSIDFSIISRESDIFSVTSCKREYTVWNNMKIHINKLLMKALLFMMNVTLKLMHISCNIELWNCSSMG